VEYATLYIGRGRRLMSDRRSRIQPDNNRGGNPGNSGGQPNFNNLGQLFNNLDMNRVMNQFSQMMGGMPGGAQGGTQPPRPRPRDPRLDLLQAMKPFLNPRRSGIIDRIGQFYTITRIIRGRNR
jgi:hypothetical protein